MSSNDKILDDIRRDEEEIDEIKYYKPTKKRLDECEEARKTLDAKYDQLLKDTNALRKENTLLEQKLKNAQDELESCRDTSRRGGLRYKELTNRIKKLEGVKATADGKTLAEVISAQLEAEKEKIETIANERFTQHLEEWKKTEKPQLVRQESAVLLSQVIQTLRKSGLVMLDQDLAKAGVYEDARRILETEAKRLMTDEVRKEIELRSDQIAMQKLERLQKESWPRYIKEHVEPKAIELTSVFHNELYRFLGGNFEFDCDKCGTPQQHRLNSMQWDDVIRLGVTKVPCINPECKDWWSRHTIPITLISLIESYLESMHPPQADSLTPN